MKLKILFLVMITSLVMPALAFPADWVMVAQTKDGGTTTFYDRESITATPDNTIRVYTKTVYNEQGRKVFIERLKKRNPEIQGYENLSYAFYHEEMNCKTREHALLEVADHSGDGKVIYRQKMNNKKWIRVLPGSMADHVFQKICPGKEEK
jgi:hypothetical protein